MMSLQNIYNINKFDYSIIKKTACQKRRKGNQGKRNNIRKYKDLFCAFDIECTNDVDTEQAFMYIWQFQIEEYTIIGRTWEEFLDFLENINQQLNDNEYLLIYVHNLSYEFCWLKGIYSFDPDEVFCIDRRKVLKCEMFKHFEFRCSYMLTNMALSVFTEKMGVTHKLSGEEFDYSKNRYSWTPLTVKELEYCITDVKALVEALKVYYSIENDNHYTIPLTSTGYVRRDIKRAMRHFNNKQLKDMQPSYEVYKLLEECFRGGDVHSNRYYTNMIVENVSSYDRVSSYPDVQINNKFPMSPWIKEENVTLDRVCRVIYKHQRACIMRVGFKNIRLKNPLWGCPYLAKHKCRNLARHTNDNGRIIESDYLETSLTSEDLKIVLDEYLFDEVWFFDFYHCRYGKLPKPFRDEVIKYFKFKTELKNVPGEELFYFLQKQKLNSIYGLTAQKQIKNNIDFINDEFVIREENEEELLEQSLKKAFICFAWGCFTTAHSRVELHKAIKLVGAERFVYCDTDSVKFIDDGIVNFDKYNKSRKTDSIKNGGFAVDKKGNTHYLGLFEYEGTYKKFATMGAKKYCYVDQEDNLHITIAGVGKSIGAKELSERGGIDAFKEGFTFYKAGGTESIYNDIKQPYKIIREGKEVEIISNVFIRNSTYTLGVTNDYKRLLNKPAIWLDLFSCSMVQ